MKLSRLLSTAVLPAALFGCATPEAPYVPDPNLASNLRLVAQSPGNVTFEIKSIFGCDRPGESRKPIRPQAVVLNSQSLAPVLGTMPRLNMPFPPNLPSRAFAEVRADANVALILRAYSHTYSTVAGSGICDQEFGIRLRQGTNYEFKFSGDGKSCRATLMQFSESEMPVVVELAPAPTACPKTVDMSSR